jgi:dolichyl-diphosphooligosaccharide--protein glycosyltransferase
VSYVAASPTFGWTGRSLSLLDPTYASKYIPIIASVSEHQPPNWSMYFTDLHVPALLAPAGLIMCFMPLTDASLFLALYGVTAVYFSGVMVRLMLVLAPAVCCLGGLAVSEVLAYLGKSLVAAADGRSDVQEETEKDKTEKEKEKEGSKEVSSKATLASPKKAAATGTGATTPPQTQKQRSTFFVSWDIALIGFLGLSLLLAAFFRHGVYVAGKMYSAPSIVMQSGGRVFDDFREAYAWMRFNTPADAKIASWWDYGYQTTAMSNRTVLVDNNTWNNTHIATVGKAMASNEKDAWDILESLDADYVFVIFGGLVGYPSDDVNKFLWMVRIAGGVYPEVRESDFLGAGGSYRVDSGIAEGLRDSLVYKLSYYRFADMPTGQAGYDRVRNTVIGHQDFKLEYFEEVLTTSHWMVRVYKRKKAPNADFGMDNGLKEA